MNGNYFIQGSEVIIEDVFIGSFESVEITEDAYTLSSTATIKIPIYTIGMNSRTLAFDRVRAGIRPNLLKIGSKIEIWTWYKNNQVTNAGFGRILQFRGFIRQVEGGFPSTIYCEDHSFILKFGKVGDFSQGWRNRTSLKTMMSQIIPEANAAFLEFRQRQGFLQPTNFNPLVFDSASADIEFSLQIYGEVSPFYALQHVINMFYMYCRVFDDGRIYAGIGIRDIDRQTISLSTNKNVLDRKLTTRDGMFENYQVVVSGFVNSEPGLLEPNEKYKGGRYTYELGDSNGEVVKLPFSSVDTVEGIRDLANRAMERLRQGRNKGTIDILMYPRIYLFDEVDYFDTLNKELTSLYVVTGRQFISSENAGFIQTLTVTNETFFNL